MTPETARTTDVLPLIVWSAPLRDPSGYADGARAFLEGLDRRRLRVLANPLTWSDARAELDPTECERLDRLENTALEDRLVHVQHCFPDSFQPSRHAIANVGRTMFETDRIPDGWADACNRMDEIWVPSEFNVETFSRSGVDRGRLHVVPEPVAITRLARAVEPLELEDAAGFNFLSVFDLGLRKGWDVLLRAFVEEFSLDHDDVALHVRVRSSLGLDASAIAATFERHLVETLRVDPERIPNVVLITDDLPVEVLARLYRSVDAFVLPTRGEGFGRPFAEAMAVGVPVIGTGWSGCADLVRDELAWVVDSVVRDVPPDAASEVPRFFGHRWAEPSVDHLRELMRHLAGRPEEARIKARAAGEAVAARHAPDVVAARVVERIEGLVG